MFEIKNVKNCPVTRASRGRVRVKRWILAELLKTMQEEKGKEWAVWLTGTREMGGLDVTVTGLLVPPQHRSSSNVKIPLMEIPSEVVVVVHSHHAMGVTFSGTDEQEFNTRYGVSIVISTNFKHGEIPATWFGFNYKAQGRVSLPCGDLGVVDFTLEPLEEAKGWPRMEPKLATHDEQEIRAGLGDCPNREVEARQGLLFTRYKASCGILGATKVAQWGIFGIGQGGIVEKLPTPVWDVENPTEKGKGYGHGYGGYSLANDPNYELTERGTYRYIGGKKESDGEKGRSSGTFLMPPSRSDEAQEGDSQTGTNVVNWLRRQPREKRLKRVDVENYTQYDFMSVLADGEVAWGDLTDEQQAEWIVEAKGLFPRVKKLGLTLQDVQDLDLEEALVVIDAWEQEHERTFGTNWERMMDEEVLEGERKDRYVEIDG